MPPTPRNVTLEIESVAVDEGPGLAEIRAKAMKPSLEALGRFDEERVRGRFLETFVPSETKKLTENGQLVGFFVIRHKPDHVHLDHLYVDPDMQSRGFGAQVIAWTKEISLDVDLPIRLSALKGSRSNDFYLSHGFVETHETEFDIHYEWSHHK